MKVTEMKQKRSSLLDDNREIISLAEQEERELTEEERKSVEDNFEKVEKLNSDIALKEKQAKAEADVDSPAEVVVKESEVTVGEERADSWEMRVVRYFNALAIGKDDQQKSFELIQGLSKQYRELPARQLEDERKRALSIIDGAKVSPDNKKMARHALGVDSRLMTTSTSDTPQAGNLLPKPFLAEVFMMIERFGVARRMFRSITMTNKELDLKNLSTKVVAYWTDEGSNITASDLKISPGKLEAKKLAGLTSWTTELSEDQAIALLPVVMESFAESMAEKEDQAAFLGDGSSTYGGFTGLLNLTNANYVTFESGDVAGSDVNEAYIRQMKADVSTASRTGAKWFMEYSTLDFLSQLENGAGFRLFPNAFRDGLPGLILGDQVELVDVMPKIDDVGADTPFIVYGDPRRALFGIRRGITADISRDAVVQNGDGEIIYNAFQGDGALLRLTERAGVKVPAAFEGSFSVAATAAT